MAAVNVAALEIPADLAHVFSKLDGWSARPGEVVTVAGNVDVYDHNFSLPIDINQHGFSKYVQMYFQDKPLKLVNEPITSPFLAKSNRQERADSIALFKLVLRYMNDTTLQGTRQQVLAAYIIQQGLHSPALRDEILVQLVNQTWQNKHSAERGWLLMAGCLCCFSPSPKLNKYLLKYISDHGYNGYAGFCQHKLLASAASVPRVYPPSTLEWTAARQRANMALDVGFSDGDHMMGHVDSWTTGEEFAAHLLQCRNLSGSQHGWTVALADGGATFECSGSEYVLDLLAEMEVAPSFPYGKSYAFVMSDRKDSRREVRLDDAHSPDRPRLMGLEVPELRTPVPVSPRPALPPESFFHYLPPPQEEPSEDGEEENPYVVKEEALSKHSVLNQRRSAGDPALSPSSNLNVRYTKGPLSPGPGSSTASSPRPQSPEPEVPLAPGSSLNQRYNGQQELAPQSKLNDRYLKPAGQQANGHVPNGDVGLAPGSKLNKRYSKAGGGQQMVRQGNAAKDQILRRGPAAGGRQRSMSGVSSEGDMEQWIDNVFDPVLDGGVAELSRGGALEARIKGGADQVGAGRPVVVSAPMYVPGSNTTTFGVPGNMSMPLGSLQLISDPLSQQQAAAQLLAQQQAAQVAAQQQLAGLSYQLQQSQSQQLAAAQLEALQKEAAGLQAALQRQALENQLLQQTVQSELLKAQLQQLQQQNQQATQQAAALVIPVQQRQQNVSFQQQKQQPSLPAQTSPNQHFFPAAPSVSPPNTSQEGDNAEETEAERRRRGVKTLTREFEKKKPSVSEVFESPQTVQFSDNIETFQRHTTSPPAVLPKTSPPPQVVPKAATPIKVQPAALTKPASPPQAPPPPPNFSPPPPPAASSTPKVDSPVKSTDSSKSGIKLAPSGPPPAPVKEQTDEMGQKIIRIGKIQWPPPAKEEEKKEMDVGKLEIDELKAKNAEGKIGVSREAQERVNAMLQQAQARQEEHVAIDMKERRRALEAQLSTIKQQKPEDSFDPPQPTHRPPAEPQEQVAPPPAAREHKTEVKVERYEAEHHLDISSAEGMQTVLYSQTTGPFLTYQHVPWKLQVRKELFTPTERLEDGLATNLVFCQIVADVFNPSCVRITRDDRNRMKSMLNGYGVTPQNLKELHGKDQMKKIVIDQARDWPYYFARLFACNGGSRQAGVQYVGVSHHGVRLLARQKDVFDDNITVLNHYKYEDIVDVSVPHPQTLQLHVKGKDAYVILYSTMAESARALIEALCIESERNVMYVRAVKSYVTRDTSLLSFQKGDIVKLTNKDMTLDRGWMYGSVHGRAGMFPSGYIQPLTRDEVDRAASAHNKSGPQSLPVPGTQEDDAMSTMSSVQNLEAGQAKFTMLEYALMNYRQSPYRYVMKRNEVTGSVRGTLQMISSLKAKTQQRASHRGKSEDWTWKENVSMVRWSKEPIQASLLKLDNPQLNKQALECFLSIMRYMGDYPLSRDQQPMNCAYTILRACHMHPELRDEVYCQLTKQTTNNRSLHGDSALQGWRLLSILTAYFRCSDQLQPYFIKYLEQNAYNDQLPHCKVALTCLQNYRATLEYGGRKNVPSSSELEAVTRGRSLKRQLCVLPGGTPVVLTARGSTVVAHAVTQVAEALRVADPAHADEYTLFYVIEAEQRYCPLSRTEYLFDITTELTAQKKEYYLLFQRTTWVYPLLPNPNDLYVDVMYHQIIPDFFDGYLLTIPSNNLPPHVIDDLALLGALQIRASDKRELPSSKDTECLVPRNAQHVANMNLQRWTNLIHGKMRDVEYLSPTQAKHRFIEILSHWPLFGSTFFNIKGTNDPRMKREGLLAINQSGVHFLDPRGHMTMMFFPFSEIISTRKLKNDNGVTYLHMKCGDLMSQKVTQIETDMGAAISTLIGQYMTILDRKRNNPTYGSNQRR